jgi:hypothetical protein
VQLSAVDCRITANGNVLSALHQARPASVKEHLLSAELHARGHDSFSYDTPSFLTSVHLFDWDSGRQARPLPSPCRGQLILAPDNDDLATAIRPQTFYRYGTSSGRR